MNVARFLALLALLVSSVTHAHSMLHASNPADGAVLAQAPPTLQLEFGGEVRLLELRVRDASGNAVKLELPAAAQAARRFELPLPALTPQAYTVEWTVMGADTHRAAGKFGFSIGDSAQAH